MRGDNTARRVSRLFLCAFPFLAAVAVGVRTLRVPGVYQAVGCALFAATAAAAWLLGARVIGSGAEGARRLALAGGLLVAPWALISLLWVGLATPWDATQAENRMRYLVLLAGSVAVTAAFILLNEALGDAGERLYSTPGLKDSGEGVGSTTNRHLKSWGRPEIDASSRKNSG